MNNKKNILSIAGSDSSAGAGIQADLKTISSLGSYGLTVITLVTAQNTMGVQSVYLLPLDIIEKQIDSIFNDIKVDAVKLGALGNEKIVNLIVKKLTEYKVKKIILDPVIFSKNMSKLLDEKAIDNIKKNLIPISMIVTPNVPEAEMISGLKINNQNDMIKAGLKILEYGCHSVLVKGGHLDNSDYSRDCLIYKAKDGNQDLIFFDSKRITTQNTHGTGCTLSSAIATFLATGFDIPTSTSEAKKYISKAIEKSVYNRLGHGCGPVEHFLNM